MNKLERQVVAMVGDDPDNPDVFKDTEQGLKPIRRSINDAVQEIILLNGGFSRSFHIPLTEGKTFYSINFNDGFLGWIENVWIVNIKRRLSQTDLHSLRNWDYRWYSSTGTPESYFPIGVNVIGVYPKPSATSDIAEVSAMVIPAPYTNDKQKVRLRKSFEWSVINYAVSEYWCSRGDVATAKKHFQIYLETLGLRTGFKTSKERIHQLRTQKDNINIKEQTSIAL